MSHVCIISGINHSLAAASYFHLKTRNSYETVSLLHNTENLSQFLAANDIHLLIAEDVHIDIVFQSIQHAFSFSYINIIILGDIPKHISHSRLYSICKRKRLPVVLEFIDLISLQSHSRHLIQSNHACITTKRLYQTIRFVEYSSTHVTFHLQESSHKLPFNSYHFIPFVDQRFVSVNASCIINANAVAKFTRHKVIMNRNEMIAVADEHLDDCWEALCLHFVKQRNCKPIFRKNQS